MQALGGESAARAPQTLLMSPTGWNNFPQAAKLDAKLMNVNLPEDLNIWASRLKDLKELAQRQISTAGYRQR